MDDFSRAQNDKSARAIARVMAQTKECAGDLPADIEAALPLDFTSEVHLPFLRRGELERVKSAYDSVNSLIDTSWNAAIEAGAVRYYEQKVAFPIDATREDSDEPLEVFFRQGDPERSFGRAWFVAYVTPATPPASIVPTKAIEDFAWMGLWESFLEDLAEICLPEKWCFDSAPENRRYGILKSYVCNTYYRLKLEGKICIADDGSFAALNTRLVDRHFDDIILCFEPQAGSVRWRFTGFAASGNRALKKRVNKTFNPLPQTAKYFDKIEDLLFDPMRELTVDFEHVLIDNVRRLPLDFLKQELLQNREAFEVVEEIQKAIPPSATGFTRSFPTSSRPTRACTARCATAWRTPSTSPGGA